MLDRLFPSPSAFNYRGSRFAVWLAALMVLVKVAIALGAIFNGRFAASVADGIPIDAYTPAGAQTVLALFGNLGLAQLALGIVGLLVVFRYRALLPCFLLLLVIEYLARKGLAWLIPIERVGGAGGGLVNGALFALLLVALALSLRGPALPENAA
jgi:hypothetical protein